jgi:multidrug efflux pump subunit AcrA (membrane-fusion protein)
MTDQELKDLVASLALAQQKTEAIVADLALSQQKTDKQLAQTDAQLAKTDAQLAKTDAQLAKTDAQLAKTDAQLAKTGAKLDKLAKMYGGVANNQGAAAEEFYFNSLKHNPVLQGIHFDSVYKNLTNNSHGIEDEYDILLLNGKDVFIIEVKYRAHPDDVKTLVKKKAANFKPLFPAYKDHKLHLGLASFHVDDKVKQSALDQGVTLLQRRGNVIETMPETPFH